MARPTERIPEHDVIDTVFVYSNISEGKHNPGSQMGSQYGETLRDALRQSATISTARWLVERRQATSRDDSNVPSKQRVAGSNPAGRARSKDVWGPSTVWRRAKRGWCPRGTPPLPGTARTIRPRRSPAGREDPAHLQAADCFGNRALRRFSCHRQMLLPRPGRPVPCTAAARLRCARPAGPHMSGSAVIRPEATASTSDLWSRSFWSA